MTLLLLGLIAFLGVHSIRVWGESWRSARIAAWGPLGWKGAYSVASLAGLALLVWGYSVARVSTPVLWNPPAGMRLVTAVLVLVAFVLFAASYVPGTRLKAAVGHPMTLAVKTWSVGHLLSNGSLADVSLFGSLLIWSVLVFSAARRRDRAAAVKPPPGNAARDVVAGLLGAAVWFLFARWGHVWLVGVSPMG
jgi:uncharacterized membrane protein